MKKPLPWRVARDIAQEEWTADLVRTGDASLINTCGRAMRSLREVWMDHFHPEWRENMHDPSKNPGTPF